MTTAGDDGLDAFLAMLNGGEIEKMLVGFTAGGELS